MAAVQTQGTEFCFSIRPQKLFASEFWARTEIEVSNEYVSYKATEATISIEELEEWITAMFRLLAGAYGKEYTLAFERAGLAVDLYPHTQRGKELSREERRKNDCVMAIRLLMRSKDKNRFLVGVYTVLLHREEILSFAQKLRTEFDAAYGKYVHGRGKFAFVGVSPLGYAGCQYWYLDPTETVEKGEYVWVRMGKQDIEQIVYTDCVRYFNDDTAPYDPETVKQILRKATEEEAQKAIRQVNTSAK